MKIILLTGINNKDIQNYFNEHFLNKSNVHYLFWPETIDINEDRDFIPQHQSKHSEIIDTYLESCSKDSDFDTYVWVTHSEHILNHFRCLIVDKKILPEDFEIIWIPTSDFSLIEKLNVYASGSLNHWPIGFFDQNILDISHLSKFRRMKLNEKEK